MMMMTMVVMMNGLNFVGARFDFCHSFKPTNCDYYFNHVFRPVRMRLDLNTNMELVGLREPYKATYKVTKNPRKTQHRQTSLKFDQTAVAFKLPFLSSSAL